MTVYISDCGGVLGPPLVRWLLEHSGAAIVGTNSDHENMGPLLTASRFRFYVVADRDDSALLRRVSDHPDGRRLKKFCKFHGPTSFARAAPALHPLADGSIQPTFPSSRR